MIYFPMSFQKSASKHTFWVYWNKIKKLSRNYIYPLFSGNFRTLDSCSCLDKKQTSEVLSCLHRGMALLCTALVWSLASGNWQGFPGCPGEVRETAALGASRGLWAGLGFLCCCLERSIASAHVSRGPVEDSLWTSSAVPISSSLVWQNFNRPCRFCKTL